MSLGSDIVSRIRGPFFLLVGVKGLLFLLLIPPWQGPDEIQHFVTLLKFARGESAQLFFTPAELVTRSLEEHNFWELSENTISRYVVYGNSSSPLLLRLLAIPFRSLPLNDVVSQLMFLRLLSLGLHLGVVWIAFLVATRLDSASPWTALTAATIVAFHPQYSFISAVFSPDGYLIFWMTLLVYLLVRLPSVKNNRLFVGTLFLVSGGALLTKQIGVLAIPLCLFGYFAADFWTADSADRFRIILRAIGSALGALAICFVGAYLFSIFDAGVLGQWGTHFITTVDKVLHPLSGEGLAVGQIFRLLGILFISFWFSYGWMIYKLSFGWYLLLGTLTALGIWGIARVMRKQLRSPLLDQHTLAIVCGCICLVFATVSLAVLFAYKEYAAGRFLFPALVPCAIMLSIGIRESAPPRYREVVAVAAILFFLLLNGVCVTKYVMLRFYS